MNGKLSREFEKKMTPLFIIC